ncbi:PSD1 and planctomycete cytochrome C domain-containing protein [Novipirellula rosea]|uniref:PSD1 and planctomycete cytochrome C domain-containing protein n=1 Tax=Novipirellula rosea TaxID=1031540 RepID=A0ABP8NGW1_9BACT
MIRLNALSSVRPLGRYAILMLAACGVIGGLSGQSGAAEGSASSETPAPASVDFIKQVQPILAKRCFACHGPDKAEGGISFAEQESAFAEAESGEFAIVAGDVDASMLVARITTDDEFERMPPEGDPVTPAEAELLTQWIAEGAAWGKHFAFEPMGNPDPPRVADPVWNENPIDAFLFKSLGEAGLKPNASADRRTLVRRAYYDLTGLPPSPAAVEAFVNNDSPDAFSSLVDELLQSPHYGERWGRHWLDLVRYAESNSFERDNPKENAWKYRDYVIKSFNDDKPYDQFVREQLAGDELDSVTTETLTATGFYRLGIWDDEPADPVQARFDEMDDLITTTGQAFLGLTINCARCHDHKIDPIPQTDYYSMLSFFEDVTRYASGGTDPANNQIDITSAELKARYHDNDVARKKIEAAMHEIEQAGIVKMSAPDQRATEGPRREREKVLKEKLKENLSSDQWRKYESLRKRLRENQRELKQLPPRNSVMGLAKYPPKPGKTFVMFRGNPHSPGDEVQPSFPEIFETAIPEVQSNNDVTRVDAFNNRSLGRRRVLADWIVSDDNRLTARVMVNRIWQFHFGRGIVRSSNNFGQLGTPPTHPELLDWLAQTFIQSGWKIKDMHRLIMNSRAYQMSSASRDDGLAIDPANDLFWRFDPRRLSAEEVRDSILAVNGSLNPSVYGPSFYEKLSAEVLAGQSRPGQGWGDSPEEQRNRRSVYIHVKRSLLTPLLTAFDFPDPDLTCEARFATLQPGQALSLLNSDFIHDQATKFAKSIDAASVGNDEVVRRAIMAAFARPATDAEIADGDALIEKLVSHDGITRTRAVSLYCLTVMNWNEFLFVD